MASISGSVTLAGDPDDWIATAFDADTHAFAGVAAVAAGAYEITGLTAGKAYMVACRPKSGPAWAASASRAAGDLIIPTDPLADPYIFRAVPADEYGDDVSLLLKFNGENNSSTFTDSSQNAFTPTRIGTPVISTAQSQYGGASGYFDGDADWLSFTDNDAFNLGAGDFTVEAWVYRSGGSGEKSVCGQWTAANELSWLITLNASNELTFYYSTNGSSGAFTDFTSGYAVSSAAWTHVCACRSGNTLKLYLDGVARHTNSSFSATIYNASTPLTVGASSSSNFWNGYLDDLRITKGVARYSGDFTPPSALALNVNGASEPTWPTTPGNTVADGDITWTNMGQLVRPLMQGPLIAA